MPSISRTLIMAGVIVLLVVLLVTLGPAACNKIRSMQAQQRLNQGQTEALGNSAQDAVQTQGKANQRERESEDLTRTNNQEIRDAEGANDPVNPAVRDAGIRSLCRRAQYRDSERCRVLKPAAP
jgi:type II secretory pathway component PulM